MVRKWLEPPSRQVSDRFLLGGWLWSTEVLRRVLLKMFPGSSCRDDVQVAWKNRGWLMSHARCLLGKRKGRYKLLVGGLEHVLFSIIYGIILPIDFHIFQRGRSTTNQTSSIWKSAHLWAMASLAVSAGPSLHVPWQNCFEGPGRVYTSDEDLGVPKMGVPQ